MPCPELSRKRQEPEDHLNRSQHQSKRLKTSGHPPPEFWDNLSKIWLTKDALRELDRRNFASDVDVEGRRHRSHWPLTRRLQATLRRRCQTLIPDPLVDCKPEIARQIKRLSRLGGPDLSDLRGYPYPRTSFYQPMSTRSSQSRKRRAEPPSENQSKTTTKTSNTTAYNRNFQQHLVEHGVYIKGYTYPDGRVPARPNNWDEINEILAQPRRSLSPSRFSEAEFQEFELADTNAGEERPVTTSVIPIIEGKIRYRNCLGEDYPFTNLAPLTDGTLASAKPDRFFGARPEQLHSQIREELGDHIIPSMISHRPIAPNFFLEAKGPDGSLVVATRQACYDGALGARGIHSLQSYKEEKPVYDDNAYTITSTYHGGTLKLYTTHLTAPKGDGRPEYIMTQLNAWSMTGNVDGFRQGASAYRNARDWAKEQRDQLIQAANERFQQAQELPSTSERETTSEPTVALEGSDTSATSDEAEFHDATWSFAQVDDEEPQASNKPTKRARTQANQTDSTSSKALPN